MSTNPPVLFADSAWNACLSSFLQHIYDKSQSEHSRVSYTALLTRFFASVAKPPERVLRSDIEQFLLCPCQSSRNRGGSPAPATRNSRLIPLASFYRFAGGYLIEDATGTIVPLFRGVSPTSGMTYLKATNQPRALSERDMVRLFAVMPTDTILGLRDRAIFLFYFWTARRRAEVARLRWGDLSYGSLADENGAYHIGWMYAFTGKGKGGMRDSAELPQPAYDALIRYLTVSGRLASMTPASPLFVAVGPVQGGGRARKPDSPLHTSAIVHALKKYARAAGLDPSRVSVHGFRHAAAHERHKAGQDVVAISHLLRHSNLATTHTYLQGLCGTADPGASLLAAKFACL